MSVSIIPERDESGREVVRYAITEAGWSFLAQFVECKTSTLDSVYCEDSDGNRETQHIAKFYDVNGNELTTQGAIDTDCVKSVFTIKIGIDYEIVSGEIHHYTRPTSNVRMHTLVGVFDNDGNSISSKPFVKNLNLKFKDTNKSIMTDGRAPKKLLNQIEGVPFEANQMQFILHHDPGFKHEIMIELEYYRQ